MSGKTGSLRFPTTGNTRVILLIILVLVFGIFSFLVYILRNWHGDIGESVVRQAESSRSDTSRTVQAEAAENLVLPMSPREREIINRHFTAVGGINQFNSMSSFRISGDLAMPDGSIYGAILIKKGRDLERIAIRTPEHIQVMVETPEDRWVAYWKLGELIRVEDMSPEIRREMIRNAPVVSELYEALQTGWIMQYLGQRDFNYRMVHVFEVKSGERATTRFYIDPDTFLNVGRVDRSFGPDGTLSITRRVYSDHIDASGLTIPGKVETYIDDALYATLHVSVAELNPGVLDSIFYRPEATIKQ